MTHSIIESIGNTPLIKIKNTNIYAKLEGLNPGGSIKDRPALFMIQEAEKSGMLKPGMTLIEPTSGNTGISLAMISAIKGYKFIAVMPDNMNKERTQLIESLGGKVIITPAENGWLFALSHAKRLSEEKNYVMLNQFSNKANIKAHQETTGKDILNQLKEPIDAFVAGIGTGGTLMGVGTVLKQRYPKVKIIAVEPEESAVMSGKKPGIHGIYGIGDGFIPDIVDKDFIDDIITVSTYKAIRTAKQLIQKGYLIGISSGANYAAAQQISDSYKNIVTVFPDRAERYLSTDLFKS